MISYDLIRAVFDLDNPLTLEYFELCSVAYDGKGEKHHILPRSIYPEHIKHLWNIVNLSYQNHYRAHEILAQICIRKIDYNKMLWSWNIISHTRDGIFISDPLLYSNLKLAHSKMLSEVRLGMKFSEEHCINIGKSKSGIKASDITKQRMSAAQKGKKMPLGYISPLKGVDLPEYWRNAISNGKLGKKHSEDYIEAVREGKSLYSYEQYTLTGEYVRTFSRWRDVLEAGFKNSQISAVCAGKRKSSLGFIWKKIPKVELQKETLDIQEPTAYNRL